MQVDPFLKRYIVLQRRRDHAKHLAWAWGIIQIDPDVVGFEHAESQRRVDGWARVERRCDYLLEVLVKEYERVNVKN